MSFTMFNGKLVPQNNKNGEFDDFMARWKISQINDESIIVTEKFTQELGQFRRWLEENRL